MSNITDWCDQPENCWCGKPLHEHWRGRRCLEENQPHPCTYIEPETLYDPPFGMAECGHLPFDD